MNFFPLPLNIKFHMWKRSTKECHCFVYCNEKIGCIEMCWMFFFSVIVPLPSRTVFDLSGLLDRRTIQLRLSLVLTPIASSRNIPTHFYRSTFFTSRKGSAFCNSIECHKISVSFLYTAIIWWYRLICINDMEAFLNPVVYSGM